jgi:predicted Zn-dependent protease with MMP-like domain
VGQTGSTTPTPVHANPEVPAASRPASNIGIMKGVVTVSVEEFDELVVKALDDIPEELRSAMDNVVVQVDDTSPPGRLFGLYEGVPLTKRGGYSASMPDRITIFMQTICQACATTHDVERQVRKTVIHEVGHHFGIGDARLRELGW